MNQINGKSEASRSLHFTHVHLENWRNFVRADAALQRRAFLVGSNASGKSNFLDAFRRLAASNSPRAGSRGRTRRAALIDARIGLSPSRVTCFLFIISVLDSCQPSSVGARVVLGSKEQFSRSQSTVEGHGIREMTEGILIRNERILVLIEGIVLCAEGTVFLQRESLF